MLVVDDEPQILRALGINLRARGYEVDLAPDGEHALDARGRATTPTSWSSTSVCPGIDGVEVIEGLRGWSTVPIIVLSVRDGEADKVAALDAGADDYVTKPFGMDELLARLRAALRRATPAEEEPVVETADFTIDLAAKRVHRATATEVRLTPTEWHLVEVLVRNQGKLVSQRQLLQEVWGPAVRTTRPNYLRVHMAHVRRKLEPEPGRPRYFLTEPGMGYRFETGRERDVVDRRRRTGAVPGGEAGDRSSRPARSPPRVVLGEREPSGSWKPAIRARRARGGRRQAGEHRGLGAWATKIITLPASTAAANGPGATSARERGEVGLRCHSSSGALARARSSSAGSTSSRRSVAAAGELDRHPSGAAAGVEHRAGRAARGRASTSAASPCTSAPARPGRPTARS